MPNLAFIASWPPNHPQFTIGSFIPLSPVTIPKVIAVNENGFSVNLPGKIWVKETTHC
jgi:hypothetical protein